MIIEELAVEVHNEGETVQQVFVDPASILIYIKIITTLITLFKNCKKSHKEATISCNTMGIVEKRTVKKIVRQEMGLVKYWFSGNKVSEKIISRAKRLEESDLEKLYQEVE